MDQRRRLLCAGLLAIPRVIAERRNIGSDFYVKQLSAGHKLDVPETPIDWVDALGDVDSQVYIPMTIGGVPTVATLDTGASTTIVDRGLASQFGIKAESSATVIGNVGKANGSWGSAVRITIGKESSILSKVLLLDLAMPSSPSGTPISVILGYDAFYKGVLDLNLAANRVAFRSSANFQPEDGAEQLQLKRGPLGEQYILASVEGREPIPTVLDSGSSNAVMLSARYASVAELLANKRVSSAAIAGIEGINLAVTTSLTSVSVGTQRVLDVPCEVLKNWYSPTQLANIGLPVLKRFRLAIDFSNAKVWLKTSAESSALPFQRDMSGLGIAVRSDRLIVVHVARGSPAASKNWVAGEVIIAVDGIAVGAGYPASQQSRWRYGPEGRQVELTVRGGSTRRLVLARYY